MRAARYHFPAQENSAGSLLVEEVAGAQPAANEVRVQVGFAGICGSDLARYRQLSTHPAILQALVGNPSPVPGHEFSGTVEAIGGEVPATWPDGSAVLGSRVVVHPQVACGECDECRAGYWTGCARPETIRLLGLHRDGGFAEFVNAPFDHLVRVPEGLSLRDAALAEPIAVALHSINIAQPVDLQKRIAVIGDGTIGLLTGHLLAAFGTAEVTLIGKHAQRMEVGETLGIHAVRTPAEIAAMGDAAREQWPLIFLTAGSQSALEMAFQMAARGGKIVTVGYLHEGDAGVHLPLVYQLIRREKSFIGSCGSTYGELSRAVELLADGTINANAMISDVVSLDQIVDAGFEALVGSQHAAGKIMVAP